MTKITILDTTLRDGDQAAGAAMKPHEKMVIAKQLERLKVDVIEAGFPAASSTEAKAVRDIADQIEDCRVSAFARALPKDIQAAGRAVKNARGGGRIEVAIPVSDIHMERQLGKSREDILELTRISVRLARDFVDDVQWIGIDSTRADRDFLSRVMETAIAEGASTVSIADTVGYVTPVEVAGLVEHVMANTEGIGDVALSIHCHDDLGLATANSLAALCAGATEVQCTVNGLGERAGNAALEEIAMAVKVRSGVYPFEMRLDTTELMATSKLVREMSGFLVPPNKAVVGDNAFKHGSGIHQDGLLKAAETYEIINPESVGASTEKISIGPHSGRHGLRHKLESLGFTLADKALDDAFALVKEMAAGRKSITDEELRALGRQFAE